MNIDQIENKMILALEGELSEKENILLMAEIDGNEALQSMWTDYKEMYQGLDNVSYEEPSIRVKDNFHNWLDNQTSESTKVIDIAHTEVKKGPVVLWRKWAGIAAVFVCALGFWSVYQHNQNVENTLADVSKQMESLMDLQSSTDRIKAIRVNYNSNDVSVDQKMIKVLIGVLNEDQSSNVRLAAVETLSNYMDQETVREALIKRLTEENDAGVKLSIITNLGRQKDQKLKSTLENIVNDDSQEKFIIDEAHMQLIRIEKMDI